MRPLTIGAPDHDYWRTIHLFLALALSLSPHLVILPVNLPLQFGGPMGCRAVVVVQPLLTLATVNHDER